MSKVHLVEGKRIRKGTENTLWILEEWRRVTNVFQGRRVGCWLCKNDHRTYWWVKSDEISVLNFIVFSMFCRGLMWTHRIHSPQSVLNFIEQTILQIALLTVWICGLMVFPVSDDSYITRRSRSDDDDDIKQLWNAFTHTRDSVECFRKGKAKAKISSDLNCK